jgi:hypothetical protein
MLVALAALFVALGGSSYAALALPKNSVGKDQLKKNSVTSVKVKQGSLLTSDFKASQRRKLRGAQGMQGVQGSQGAPGTQGVQGDRGAAGPFPDGAIPSGKTIRGAYSLYAPTAVATLSTALSFGFRLANPPSSYFIGVGEPVPVGCPGTAASPEAQTGYLCVYEAAVSNRAASSIFAPGGGGAQGAGREGAVLEINGDGDPTVFFSYGTWAVTSG